MCSLYWNLGALDSWNPQGLSRPLMGLLYLYLGTVSIYCRRNSSRASLVMTLDKLHNILDKFRVTLNSVNVCCHPVQHCVCSVALPWNRNTKIVFSKIKCLGLFLLEEKPNIPFEFSTSCERKLRNLELKCMLFDNETCYRNYSKWPPAAWLIKHSVANHCSNTLYQNSFKLQTDILNSFL